MQRRPQQFFRLTLLCALGLAATAAAGFAAPWGAVPRLSAAGATAAKLTGQAAKAARVPVMVELFDPPAAVDWAVMMADKSVPRQQALANAAKAAKAKIALLEPKHQALSAALAAAPIHAQELFRVKRVMNAVAVLVDRDTLDQIRALPGVKRVRVITPEFPVNATSVPFIGAPQVWANTLGLPANATGTGMKIGIIDTGIDYQHPMFGGSGLLADYQANDRVTIHPGLFPTAKVVGGFDFVGDDYDGTNTPKPDPNPTDCFGHGSHVAGTAAGFGVKADGTTYTGTYGPSTPFSSLRIGPGVAPQALLYAIRIFGCAGSTNVAVQGIEFAVDPDGDGDFSDHLDVINMSFGSPFGGISDTSAQAAQAASLVGVISVASQGNDGDTFFIAGSPASADYVIATAASADAGVLGVVVNVTAPAAIAGKYPAEKAGAGPALPTQAASVVLVHSATGTPNQGCDANYTNAAAVKGNIALIQRGTCNFQPKVANAQKNGAIAAIIYDNRDEDLIVITGDASLASVFISQADGKKIAADSGTAQASFGTESEADTLAGFSSRGPRGGGSFPIRLKPDITAPGLAITSTQTGMTCKTGGGCFVPTPNGFDPGGQALTIQGTSMAAPHVAGSMALLRELHPDWSVEELKALVMNGAVHDITRRDSTLRYGLGRVGAGRVDVASSAQHSVTAFNDDDPGLVTLSFDSEVVSSIDQVKQVRVVNHGSQAATFNLGFDDITPAPGVAFSLVNSSQGTLTVPAASAIQVPVQMKADATKMQHVADATVFPAQSNLPRHTLTEAGSYLTFSQAGKTTMRLPLYSAPVPTSEMAGTVPIATGGSAAGASSIQLTGIGVCTAPVPGGCDLTNAPVDVASLVTPFEGQVAHFLDPTVPTFANIQYAGVAYDSADGLLLFGISTWGPWSTPNDFSFNIYVDSQNTGSSTFDKIIFNSDIGSLTGAGSTDVFVTGIFDIASQSIVGNLTFVNLLAGNQLDTRLFNNNVMVLAVSPADLGLAGTSFRYRIETCPASTVQCVPRVDGADGPYTWDFAAQGLDFGGNFLAFDLNGSSVPLNFNVPNFVAHGSLGALLLHTHNGGTQAQVLPFEGERYADLAVASSVSPATIPAKSNASVTLTLKVSNAGPNTARQVRVSDALPSGLAYLSDDSGGAYDPSNGLWTVGRLAAGASATIHIKAAVVSGGEIVNTAQVASSKPIDPNPENDASTLTLNAPRLADLALTASASAGSVSAGSPVTFTLNLANKGGDPSYNPRVHVVLGGASYTTAHISLSQGTFDTTSGIWQLGSVGNGATETLKLTVFPRHGSVGIHATAIASTPDPNLLNNHAAVSVTVH
jgi:uncharacterized repeat protein (TIGR01451 family)